jgi:rhamnosyltransferase
MTVACIVVTYNPDAEFPSRLSNLQREFDKIVVVDNNSNVKPKIVCQSMTLICNSTNLGIATALNQGIVEAVSNGAEYICLFDQDSVIDNNFVSLVLTGFKLNNNIGIVAGNYMSPVSGKLGYPTVHNEDEYVYSPISHAITSGSMIKASILPVCGLMRDDYFIDYVDVEFSERVRRNGFTILCTNKALMTHPIGEATNHRFFSYKLTASNHSPTRRYYMARNCIAAFLENITTNKGFALTSLNRLFRIIIVTLLFEKQKSRKLRALVEGMTAGFQRKMGKAIKIY